MAQEYVESVRAVYERWAEGDFRASLDLLDPQVILVLGPEFSPESPDGMALVGVDAIVDYTRNGLLVDMAHLTMEADEFVVMGDTVLVSVHQRGVGRASGVPTQMRFFTLWSFRGGKVIRIESFRDRAEAFEAAGLERP